MAGKAPEAFRTISEVAEILDTPPHVLRFWESKFTQLRPVKRAGGRRYYRPADLALLAGIRQLLHVDGMTIRGVQKLLREKGARHVAALGGIPGEAASASAAYDPADVLEAEILEVDILEVEFIETGDEELPAAPPPQPDLFRSLDAAPPSRVPVAVPQAPAAAEPGSEAAPEPAPQPEHSREPDPKAGSEAVPERAPREEPEPTPDTAEAGTQAPEPEEEREPPAEAEPEPEAEVEPQAEVEQQPEPVVAAETEPVAELAPVAEVERQPEPVAEAESLPEAEPEPVVEMAPAAEAEPESVPEPEPEPEPESEPESGLVAEPEAEMEPVARLATLLRGLDGLGKDAGARRATLRGLAARAQALHARMRAAEEAPMKPPATAAEKGSARTGAETKAPR
jgi:DNA-binding transcriptional MerR regulator